MSNLLTGIAPQAALMAQSTSQTAAQAARNAEGNAAQTQAIQRLVTSGAMSNPAVVVSLSGDGKARAASYGEGRAVDGSFENQAKDEQLEGAKDKEKKDSGSSTGTLSVTA